MSTNYDDLRRTLAEMKRKQRRLAKFSIPFYMIDAAGQEHVADVPLTSFSIEAIEAMIDGDGLPYINANGDEQRLVLR